MNRTVLMSGPKYFAVDAINPYEDVKEQPDLKKATVEFEHIKQAFQRVGIRVVTVDDPPGCQHGIFTANWGLCRNNICVQSWLPPRRDVEEPYAEAALKDLGLRVVKPPYRFSGQGDALPCGNLLFAGGGYRSDPRVHSFLADTLGYEVISLQAVPSMDAHKRPVTNAVTGWPDSLFYDIDLAISILRKDLIAWCPEAFMPESQERMHALNIQKIEVSLEETMNFGCNLVSTGEAVVMGAHAPKLKAAIKAAGLHVETVELDELPKGGGYIRCTSLTLDND